MCEDVSCTTQGQTNKRDIRTTFQHALPFLNHKVTQLSGSLCTSENKVAVMSEWPAFQTDVEDQIKPPQTPTVSRLLGQLQKHRWPLVLRDLTG